MHFGGDSREQHAPPKPVIASRPKGGEAIPNAPVETASSPCGLLAVTQWRGIVAWTARRGDFHRKDSVEKLEAWYTEGDSIAGGCTCQCRRLSPRRYQKRHAAWLNRCWQPTVCIGWWATRLTKSSTMRISSMCTPPKGVRRRPRWYWLWPQEVGSLSLSLDQAREVACARERAGIA
jgi:hypothetical protein